MHGSVARRVYNSEVNKPAVYDQKAHASKRYKSDTKAHTALAPINYNNNNKKTHRHKTYVQKTEYEKSCLYLIYLAIHVHTTKIYNIL